MMQSNQMKTCYKSVPLRGCVRGADATISEDAGGEAGLARGAGSVGDGQISPDGVGENGS